MKPPVCFLSSTIFDFKDLRSALKFSLEEQGCVVNASEFNDFDKPLDGHSYDACLRTIERSDIFILLIGGRVGGIYDYDHQISITRQEYRHAYQLAKQGKIRIATFVRKDIWDLRANQKDLAKHLKKLDLKQREKDEILSKSSRFSTDAEAVINFIDEVGKNSETSLATSGKGDFPTANWIHVFDSFRDIYDALRPHISIHLPIAEAAVRETLRYDLLEILASLLVRIDENDIASPKKTIQDFFKEHEMKAEIRSEHYTQIGRKRFELLYYFLIELWGKNVDLTVLNAAMSSPAFLQYDTDKKTFRQGDVYDTLYKLRSELVMLNRVNNSEIFQKISDTMQSNASTNYSPIRIKTFELLELLHLMMRWSNSIDLLRVIIAHFDGQELLHPELFPRSPIKDFDEQIEKESVTRMMAEAFVNDGNP